MQRRYNLTHFILAGVVALGLTPLMGVVAAQARIAFQSDGDGNRDGNQENYEIYVMDSDGNNQQRLTDNDFFDIAPSWSPAGERIVFASNPDGKHENYEIYVMENDGGNQQKLTNNPHRDNAPEWLNSPFSVSPAGKKFTIWGWLKQVDR